MQFETPETLVGIIPAAGYATRLQPLSGSKEVVPVGGRPVMDYLVARMKAAGCVDLRVVTRPEKRDVALRAVAHGAAVIEGRPDSVAASILLGMDGLRDRDIVLFGFPDTIWEPEDGFASLLDHVRSGWQLVLGLFRCSEPSRADVVTVRQSGEIAGIRVKPTNPSSRWIWGCGAGRAGVLRGLEGHQEPGRYFDLLARSGSVLGVRLSRSYLDIGTRTALDGAISRAT